MRNLLLYLMFSIFVISCNRHNKSIVGKMCLSYDNLTSNLVDTLFKYDSIFVDRINADSIVFTRYLGGGGCFVSTFHKKYYIFYESRQLPYLFVEGETESYYISIPTFLQKDTIFDYFPDKDYFPVFVFQLSLGSCTYQIKKEKENFVTIKQSLIDTTYKEMYYYDRYYNVYKYVNMWKKNYCVYLGNVSD